VAQVFARPAALIKSGNAAGARTAPTFLR
jgi:hypothetical protein